MEDDGEKSYKKGFVHRLNQTEYTNHQYDTHSWRVGAEAGRYFLKNKD
jgi:hypothetical protein